MAMKYRKELRLDGFTLELLDELKRSGKFGSEAAIIRFAVQDFARTELPRLKNRVAEVGNAPTGERTEILSGCNNLAEIFGVHQ